jgi:hypothetical protein
MHLYRINQDQYNAVIDSGIIFVELKKEEKSVSKLIRFLLLWATTKSLNGLMSFLGIAGQFEFRGGKKYLHDL